MLTAYEKEQLEKTIEKIEGQTAGELVAVITRMSDRYLYIPLLWSACAALALPAFAVWQAPYMTFGNVYQVQVLIFIVLAMLLRWPPLLMPLVPKGVRTGRAARYARQMFVELGLHDTQHRGGVMVFVSDAERHVEIIADKGIAALVPQTVWQSILDDFVADIRAGELANGYEKALQRCGAVLVQHMPARSRSEAFQRLPNAVVELDAPLD
ncbi:MAG: hypothetical protein GC134_06685 [Proteobacteria bacterium]|nr:hypothetical protein [Pseudomonadota bacterium]